MKFIVNNYYDTYHTWPSELEDLKLFFEKYPDKNLNVNWKKLAGIRFIKKIKYLKIIYYDIPEYIKPKQLNPDQFKKYILLKIPNKVELKKMYVYKHTLELLEKYSLNNTVRLKSIYFDKIKKLWFLQFDDPMSIDEEFKILIANEKTKEFIYKSIMWKSSEKYGSN